MQDPIHGAAVFSDREIMHKTLLRGEAVIFGRKVIDSLAVKRRRVEGGGYSKESVKLAHWKQVMLAGLAKHRVGAYDSGATCITHPNQPRVRLDLPPDDQAALQQEFHNRFVDPECLPDLPDVWDQLVGEEGLELCLGQR